MTPMSTSRRASLSCLLLELLVFAEGASFERRSLLLSAKREAPGAALAAPATSALAAPGAAAGMQHLAAVVGKGGANASTNASAAAGQASQQRQQGVAAGNATAHAKYPFNPRVGPAVGKVFSLYYSSYSDAKATSVEAGTSYAPTAGGAGDVWLGGRRLGAPSCHLKVASQTNYPTDNREANLRLVELAMCSKFDGFSHSLPTCGEGAGEVCQLELFAPLPSSDEHQEPYIGAAMALAAYSRLCAASQSSEYDAYKCQIHSSMSAIAAGLEPVADGQTKLRGLTSPGMLDLKLSDAYVLNFEHVYLATEDEEHYFETDFYHQLHDVLHWSHAPPAVHFCPDLDCLITDFIGPH